MTEDDEDRTVPLDNAKQNDGEAWLICTKAPADAGIEVGHVLELSPSVDFSIGRGNENTLSVQSDELSRSHLNISFSNGDWIVEDVGSTNGTYVNGDRIQSKNLKAGDSLGFGGLEFDFTMDALSPDSEEHQMGNKEGRDHLHSGYVSADLMKDLLPSNNYAFYICGPPSMMESLIADLKEWGVPESDIHFEAFGPAPVKKATPDKPAAEKAAAAAGIEVIFAKSGKTLKWDPEIDSLLEFAEENDVDIEFGCRAGSCGTCITAIREGDVTYVVEPGSPPEAGSCLTCISVPKTSITLDA